MTGLFIASKRVEHDGSRRVAAVLVSAGGVTRASVDPRTPVADELGPVQPSALLVQAVIRGRQEREAGIEALKRSGREAYRTRQRQRDDAERTP
jgi:hypothetical protein